MLPSLRGPALLAPEWEGYARDAVARMAALNGTIPDGATALAGVTGTRRLYPVVEGVAVVGVSGLLVHKLGFIGCDFITGYDGIRAQLAQAFADPEVRAIVLDIDSGGGTVAGCFDLVDWIVAAKAESGKTVAAILSEEAYSAAYAIATAADSIAVPQTGGVGSIGAVIMHLDISRLLEHDGVAVSLIHAGQHKVDGNPFQALPDTVRADWQRAVDDTRRLFAAVVARNRQAAGAALTEQDALDTEARCLKGPTGTAEAVRIGLADAVMPPDAAFAAVLHHLETHP
ncbi:S49 family peptidase [Roseospira navarrensis]|uniref:S49 family peptidase n=1 Tax=Roseospira navarrensis TaxID=140058 RepID=A0A7X2D627_9PROT|nr:S49 family peptidase [Roseospira navarrensis]MQX37885.1 S49 family peptidase [Roseospira navarrensis]